MTCPQCRDEGKETRVDIVNLTHDKRSVEAKFKVLCPECGWEGGPYAL